MTISKVLRERVKKVMAVITLIVMVAPYLPATTAFAQEIIPGFDSVVQSSDVPTPSDSGAPLDALVSNPLAPAMDNVPSTTPEPASPDSNTCSSPQFKVHFEDSPEESVPTRDGLSPWGADAESEPTAPYCRLLLINDRRSDTRPRTCKPMEIGGSQAARW
jgi:hypothetical protein